VTNLAAEEFLRSFITEMAAFVARLYTVLPRRA